MADDANTMIAKDPEKFGAVWFPATSVKEMIDADRIKLAGTDNGMVVEVDGTAWAIPEAYRLGFWLPR